MDETLIQNARAYAARHQLCLADRLGFGIHGIVFLAENNLKAGRTAIKVHRTAEPFHREVAVYQRLKAAGIRKILDFNVPRLTSMDDELLVFEMTVVERPFVLDFAGAYLDVPPDFPPAIWDEWETEKREQFDVRWPKVQDILGKLEELDIHMLDVSPSNVAFLD